MPKHRLFEILSEIRDFGFFWFGQSSSEIGTRLTGFGLSIWVYQNTHTVAQLSLVIFFTTLPGVLITPLVGALVDRWNRQWIIIFSDVAAALVTLILALLLLTGHLQLWHTYVSAFCTSVCGSFQMTAKSAALPMMVPKNQIGRANGLIQFSTALGQLAAPVLAGVLISKFQLEGLLLIDFSTYIIALLTLFLIKIPQLEPDTQSGKGITVILDDIIEGWKNISSHFLLMIILIFMTLHFFFNGMTTVLIEPLILSFASPATFGSILSIAGSGMVLGSLVMSILGVGKKSISNLFIFSALNGIALIITGLKPFVITIASGLFLSFFTLPIILVINYTIWQTTIHPKVQGRVISLFSTVTGLGLAVGNISASPLSDGLLEPMLSPNGILASSVGQFIATGPGRGIACLIIIEGILFFLISISLYTYFSFQQVDEIFLDIGRVDSPLTKS